ncbi:helix-turn-helix domain-containing protein [Thermogutta sp.]|uniref:helix-turn-helix domain-containing protein n=2 Tax=Thermogutta sp. TaxID=1962930 RepID=UPI00321FDEAD
MAQKFYTTKEAAEFLGLAPADLNAMRERNEIRGFRDGNDWKYRAEDIEALKRKLRADATRPAHHTPSSDEEIVLLDEDLAPADLGTSGSGTVIGAPATPKEGASDVKVTGSDIAARGAESRPETPAGQGIVSPFEDELLPIEPEASQASAGTDSAVNLGGEKLEDDDVVIGGSGSGSDIRLASDSGLSLMDTNDSGISLESELELVSTEDSLELDDDDMLALDESVDTEAPTQLKTDHEFMLTPFDEAEEEETESGSQVIALDTEPSTGSSPGMAELLGAPTEAPFGVAPAMPPVQAGVPPVGVTPVTPSLAPTAAAVAAMPAAETPWGTLWVTMLIVCTVLLALCGMMCFDLVRNMWSWHGPFSLNSFIMDSILSVLPK